MPYPPMEVKIVPHATRRTHYKKTKNKKQKGGNWEFEYYTNNRSNSWVDNGILYLKPTLTNNTYGDAFLTSGTLDLGGSGLADSCTAAFEYGTSKRMFPLICFAPSTNTQACPLFFAPSPNRLSSSGNP